MKARGAGGFHRPPSNPANHQERKVPSEVSMQRRDFLKISAATLVVSVIPLGILGIRPVEAAANGLVYRANSDGRIYFSNDSRKTWQFHSYLGPMYSIFDLFVDPSERIRARVGFSGRSFDLVLSKKGKYWNTI